MNNSLSKFKKFKKRKEVKPQPINKDVWIYTRVSSERQKENYSLGYQLEKARAFAKENGYNVALEFGKESESASDDFTRKEFSNLIDAVRKSKNKPFAILVYIISRFSRSGGGAIRITEELVHNLGVNLIEVSSGLNTSTEWGYNAVLYKLLDAKKENLDRLKSTLPGYAKVSS